MAIAHRSGFAQDRCAEALTYIRPEQHAMIHFGRDFGNA